MSQNALKLQNHILPTPALSVKIGSIPSPHLVECHALGINSLLEPVSSALRFSSLLCQA